MYKVKIKRNVKKYFSLKCKKLQFLSIKNNLKEKVKVKAKVIQPKNLM